MKTEEKQYKIIDLFAGIGGFHLGFSEKNFECKMACDITSKDRVI